MDGKQMKKLSERGNLVMRKQTRAWRGRMRQQLREA